MNIDNIAIDLLQKKRDLQSRYHDGDILVVKMTNLRLATLAMPD